MKTAKPPPPENSGGSNRRAQPVRQTRINPPRTSSLNRNNSLASEPVPQQPIDIFPGVTHFADAITALPKELVRHFTLLKEVDAKIFTPEAALFQFVDEALRITSPEPTQLFNDAFSSAAAASTPASAHNGSARPGSQVRDPSAPSGSESGNAAIYDPTNLPRRHLLRQAAFKMQEMLVSLEEKNHVITTANEALQKQLSRIEEIWPHLESEFSEEAKWGSDTHWAYVENRASKATQAQTERSRRDGAAALSAAAQQLAEEAAARSSDRKQALAAKKNSKAQAQAQAADAESDGKPHEPGKKGPGTGKSRKPAVDPATVGLGISNPPTTNGTPAPKRRTKGTTTAAPADRAMSTVFGTAAPKPKTTSPRETPVPEPPAAGKKRKALPTSSGQAKKSRTNAAMSPSVASSPLLANFPDSAKVGGNSPIPLPPQPRPASSRARKNSTSTQVNGDTARQRPTSAASSNKQANGSTAIPPAADQQDNGVKGTADAKLPKETSVPIPTVGGDLEATSRPETEIPPPPPDPASSSNGSTGVGAGSSSNNKKEGSVKIEEREVTRKETPTLPTVPATVVTTTKSGRASKPSTPALATFAEAAGASTTMSRSRSARNAESNNKNDSTGASVSTTTTTTKRSHKKGASLSAAAAAAAQAVASAAAQQGGSSVSHDKESGGAGGGGVGKNSKDKDKDKDSHREGSANETGVGSVSKTGKGGGADGNSSSASSRNGPGGSASSHSGSGNGPVTSNGGSGPGSGAPLSSAGGQLTNHGTGNGGNNGRNVNNHAKNPSAGNAAQAGAGTATEDDDDDVDMDEQRYCFCNGVSYGEMVACDGDGCPREWFHLECVGLKVAPKGNAKWYCEDCKKRLRASERR